MHKHQSLGFNKFVIFVLAIYADNLVRFHCDNRKTASKLKRLQVYTYSV